ncbi:MFS transporter [Phaeacidiphilus oryzae]|uniref:MFS transporter n=1 Tax=Phaeacidiphilus oryzae TaxID=348818 RepID=UPI00068EF4CE|nr:MFS transporter [Phaeacidiphilus oryzae]
MDSRGRALRHPAFRRFLIGQSTSLLGSGMNTVGTAFAVLALPGGGPDAVGLVMAVRIVAVLVVLLLGGVLTDRLGARAVMLGSDALRFAAQGALAALLLTGAARLWELVLLAVLLGVGEGGFGPGLTALVPGLVPTAELTRANSLLQIAKAVATVAGPGLAGLLVAVAGAGTVVAADAASYGVSVVALWGLRTVSPAAGTLPGRAGLAAELVSGWREFASRTWLWVTTLHIGLFNLLLWAPFLVLGPVIAARRLGGAGEWGIVLAVYGAGSVAGGVALLGRRPRRALFWSMAASAGWALPAGALALGRAAAGWWRRRFRPGWARRCAGRCPARSSRARCRPRSGAGSGRSTRWGPSRWAPWGWHWPGRSRRRWVRDGCSGPVCSGSSAPSRRC